MLGDFFEQPQTVRLDLLAVYWQIADNPVDLITVGPLPTDDELVLEPYQCMWVLG